MADILPPPPVGAPFTSYNWTDWYKKVRDAINQGGNITWSQITSFTGSNLTQIQTRNHNSLQSIQGGAPGEYYHLTAAEYANVAAGGFTFTKLNADVTATTTTPVTVASFTPAANSTYSVEVFLILQSTSTSVGCRPGIHWPSGLVDGCATISVTDSTTGNVIANITYTADGYAAGANWPVANGSYPATMQATFTTGASPSGNFAVTIATEI